MPQKPPAAPPPLAALLRAPATVGWLALITVAALFALTQVPLDGVGLAHHDGLSRADVLALRRLGLRAGLRGALFTLLGAAWLVVGLARWLDPTRAAAGDTRARSGAALGPLAIGVFGLFLWADHLAPTESTWLDVPIRAEGARAEAIPRWRDDAAALAPVAGGHRGVCVRLSPEQLRCAIDLAGEELGFEVSPGRSVKAGDQQVVWEATAPDIAAATGALTVEPTGGRARATRFELSDGSTVRVPDLELLVHPSVDPLLGPMVVGTAGADPPRPVGWLAPRLVPAPASDQPARWRGGEVARLRLRPAAHPATAVALVATALLGLLILLGGRAASTAAERSPAAAADRAPGATWKRALLLVAALALIVPAGLGARSAGAAPLGVAATTSLALLAIATMWMLPGPVAARHRGALLALLCVAWPLAPATSSLWASPDALRLLGLREGVASAAVLGQVVPRDALAPWAAWLLAGWRWLAVGLVLLSAWTSSARVRGAALALLVGSACALLAAHASIVPNDVGASGSLLLLGLVARCLAAVVFLSLGGREAARGALPALGRRFAQAEWATRLLIVALLAALAATQTLVGAPAWWRGGDGGAVIAFAASAVVWPLVRATSTRAKADPGLAVVLLVAARAACALALLGGGWTAWRVAGLWLP